MENQRKKKSARGAIAAGVFIALYLVTYFIIGAICMPVAVLFLIMPEVVAFFCSAYIPHDADKIPRLGADFYSRVSASLLLIASGHIPIAPVVSIPAGIVAALIAKQGNYRSFKWNTISHMVFSWNLFGGFIPIWVMRDHFFQDTYEGHAGGTESRGTAPQGRRPTGPAGTGQAPWPGAGAVKGTAFWRPLTGVSYFVTPFAHRKTAVQVSLYGGSTLIYRTGRCASRCGQASAPAHRPLCGR